MRVLSLCVSILALASVLWGAVPAPADAFVLGTEITYAGMIRGDLEITLELSRQGSVVTGRYMYDHVGQWLSLSGDIAPDNTFYMDEFSPEGENTGVFIGTWTLSALDGEWVSPDRSTSLSFHAVPAEWDEPVKGAPWSLSMDLPVHPTQPVLTLRLTGVVSDTPNTVVITDMEVLAQDGRVLQAITHLRTETPMPGQTDFYGQGDPVVVEDMNFDGYNDFRLKEFTPLMGNTAYLYWLYEHETNTFWRSPTLEILSSPSFDPATQTISSYDRGPGGMTTMTYAIDNGELVKVGEEYESFQTSP
ncbi:MAG: hypothetical protein D6E12_10045 [Desulfovibrio sp.]|nr:MAG: hypothetical protein D6E12_10045 [Desulfovibrio sp.]